MRRIASYFTKNLAANSEKTIYRSKLVGGTLLASAIASGLIINQKQESGLTSQFADSYSIAEDTSTEETIAIEAMTDKQRKVREA